MKATELIFLAVICLAAALLCLHGWLVAGDGPLVIAAPAGLALVLILLAAVRALETVKERAGSEQAELQAEYWRQLSGSLRPMLGCLLAAPLLLLLGYPLGLAVFAAGYARAFGAGRAGALILAALTFAAVWFGAADLLGIGLPLLPEWLA
jgi:hypothetical protein